MTSSRTRRGRDEGSVVLSLTVTMVLLSLAAVAVSGTRLAVDHRIAQSAADLAALAAAQDLGMDPASACGHAADVAFANAAHVVDCRIDRTSVWISVVRDSVHGVPIRATARAGYDSLPSDEAVQEQ